MTGAFLLETSAYSALRRGHAEISGTLREAERIAVSAVVIGELLSGFFRGGRRRENEEELRRFLASPRTTVLPVDEETADRYARILNSLHDAGTPIPTNGVWIAASAMQHGLILLTTDAHFLKVPQVIARCFPA